MNPLSPDDYPYDADASLGGALRTWIDLNNTNVLTAAAFLDGRDVRGAIQNIHAWLRGDPVGELLTFRAKPFQEATGIDVDRLVVISAKRDILKEEPRLKTVVRFDRYQTRTDLLETLDIYIECYGSIRHVAYQLDIDEGNVDAFRARRYLPGNVDLKKLIVGISCGLIQAMCIEDYFLTALCRGLFQREPHEAIDGIWSFEDVLKALYGILGTRNRAADKEELFGLRFSTVDRIRKWEPRKNSLPVETVGKLLRALLRQRRPDLFEIYDERIGAFLENWTIRVKKTKGPAVEAAAKEDPPPEEPIPPPEPVPEAKPFAIAIGETLDGLEHCLGESGFPDFRTTVPTEEDAVRIERICELMRTFALAIGGLSEKHKKTLMKQARLGDNVEELVLILYGLYKFDNARNGLAAIRSNLDMARDLRPPRSTK